MAYDCFSETHGDWENNDGACGAFVFKVVDQSIALDCHERFTDSENYTPEFLGAFMAHTYHRALYSVKKWGGR